MSRSTYSHIIFDAGGTLIGTNTDTEFWYEQFFVDRFAEHDCQVSTGDVRLLLKQASHSFPEESRCSSDAQTRRFWEHVYGQTFAAILCPRGMTTADAHRLACHYIDRFESGEYVQLFPGAKETLTALIERGYKTGIISNFATYLRSFLKKLDLAELIDFLVISAEHNCEKPASALFEAGLSMCEGASPQQVLYVGDNLNEDYYPACNAGMHAILLDRYGQHEYNDRVKRIAHLDEVLAYL